MRHGSSLHFLFVLFLSCLPRAQSPTWTMRTTWPPPLQSGQGAMAFDLIRGRSVLVGNPGTYEWDGAKWLGVRSAVSPPNGQGTALAFDVFRARTVRFGGGTNETWEWDGVTWLQRFPLSAPSPRAGHCMAFDIALGRVLLFGGSVGGRYSNETWEWNGVGWTQRLPARRPAVRLGHGMAYDLSRNRTVLFGGTGVQLTPLADTWEWDGVNWTQMQPLHTPNASSPAMVFDTARQVTLLFAGTTWTWDGIDWTQLSPPANPIVDRVNGFAFDVQRQRAVLIGGTGTAASPLTFEWDGSTWTERRTGPVGRSNAAVAYGDARGSALLFGGQSGGTTLSGAQTCYGDTWQWDGASWAEVTTANRPGPRSQTALVHDGRRDRYVLFGGLGNVGNILGDTWEIDRTNWIQRVTAPSPPARLGHAMTFDAVRGRVVLFGGSSAVIAFGDTWEWDGTSWTQPAAALQPSARFYHAMTFDPVRRRTLLFGGEASSGLVNDTWEWNGTTWLQRTPATLLPARKSHVMTWDAARARAIVFGGTSTTSQPLADTWEWDGANWAQAAPATSPPATSSGAAAYDSQRGAQIVFGGESAPGFERGDLWEYATPGFAVASTFGQGCGSPALTASASAGSRPVLGATQTIDISNVPAGFAAMAYGFSRNTIGTTSLPLDLGVVGMTGCTLLQSSDRLFESCASTGPTSATHSVSVPNLPSLLSLRVWLQAWAHAPGQNAAGLIASNAVSLLLGNQ